jgi:hypothetical protein
VTHAADDVTDLDAQDDSIVDNTNPPDRDNRDKPTKRKSAVAGIKLGKSKALKEKGGEHVPIEKEVDQPSHIHPPASSGEDTEVANETFPLIATKRAHQLAVDKTNDKDGLDPTASDLATPASQNATQHVQPPSQMVPQSLPIGKPTPVSRPKQKCKYLRAR